MALGDARGVVCDAICVCRCRLSAWRAVFGHAARGALGVRRRDRVRPFLVGWCWECSELCERGGEFARPGPGALEFEACAAPVKRESCGCVEDRVAQSLGIGFGELAVE